MKSTWQFTGKFFGAKLIYKSWKAVNQRAAQIDAQKALDEFASWDIPCEGITEENKLNVARLYLAICEVIDELGGVDGIGANCLNESMYSNTTPCLIWNMLFEKYGIIWCCEGDTLTLISTYVLYQSLRQPIMMTNIYPFLVGKAAIHHEKIDDFPPVPDPENYALGVHCGYAGFAPRSFCSKVENGTQSPRHRRRESLHDRLRTPGRRHGPRQDQPFL